MAGVGDGARERAGRGAQGRVVGILSRKIYAETKGRVCLNSVPSQCARGKSSLA